MEERSDNNKSTNNNKQVDFFYLYCNIEVYLRQTMFLRYVSLFTGQ